MSDSPPIAKRVPAERTHHGRTFIDHYSWLANSDDPDTLAYLKAENDYTEAATGSLAPLRETLFNEIKRRTQETDLSVPIRQHGYWYYTRTVEGKQYPIRCRRPVGPGEVDPPDTGDGKPLLGEQVLLDGNELAEGKDYFSLGTYEPSPDGRWLAYSVDYAGDERFTLHVKNLDTGQVLADEITGTFYGSAWSADASVLFYLTVNDAWRPYRVWRHRVGTPASDDELVYEESDERFSIGVRLTRSRQLILIESHSLVTSEVRLIPADDPTAEPRVVAPRRQGVEYEVEHDATGDRLLVLHNDGALDFALAWTPVRDPGAWHPLIDHVPGVRLSTVDAFAGHVVVSLRRDGLTGLRVLPAEGEPYEIALPEPIYQVELSENPEYQTNQLRLRYVSLITPESVYDYDLTRRDLILRKRQPVLGGYNPDDYEQQRQWATATDGARVPISLVYRKHPATDRPAPCLLYGYGSYETSIDPYFSVARLSLLDRGVVFAIAHVRGGGELGRRWYEDGKLLAKKNTFTDFVACAEHLINAGWTTADRLVARGGSAGGLLMGAVANLAPERFAGIVAQVPFVDPLTTILDPSLPLTVAEWEEWGNPLESAEVYEYMRSYSPYENAAARPYPPILAVTSLNDTRVRYVEPAKWIAALRAVAPDGTYLLKTEMDAGHGGRSGRYNAWQEEAFVLAWILQRLGLA